MHHLGQMDAFLNTVEKDVLSKGLRVRMEDLWNKNGRDAVREITHRIAAFFTFAVPEKFGLKEAAKDALTAPLDEALGWPAGKDRWEQLTDAEKEAVQKKATSILDLIEHFDRTKAENFHETVQLAQGMKPASASALETVPFDESGQVILPSERVTKGNINTLISAHGEAVASLMLLRQLQGDFGSGQPPSGFLGAYAEFLQGVNKNIDVHLDVGRVLNILGKRYDDLMKWLLIAAGVGFAIGVAGTIVVLKVGSKAARAVVGGLWSGAKGIARLPGRLLPSSGAGVSGGASAAEKVVEGAAKTSRIGRVLGPLGIVLTAADLVRVLRRDARLQPLQELNGIEAAIELWGNDKIVDTTVPRHGIEMRFLERRLQCFVMEDGSNRLLQALEKEKPNLLGESVTRAEQLQSRCAVLRDKAKDTKNKYMRFFPITEYLVTDPKRSKGNVGVNWRGLDEARQRGRQTEERFRQSELMSREEYSRSLRVEYEQMQREYESLLGDTAEFLDGIQKKGG
jgi:hypothetical protein